MGWLHVVGSLELQVSFAKEPYKRALLHVFPYGVAMIIIRLLKIIGLFLRISSLL